jgi:hypothetical protein
VTKTAAQTCASIEIPATFVDQRVIATPVAASGGQTLRLWVDSNGAGFLFDDVARRYGTLVGTSSTQAPRARLPAFTMAQRFPLPSSHDGTLSVMPKAGVRSDPIFFGLDGQLGASWLQRRVWTFDYPRRALVWHCDGAQPPHAAADEIPISFATDANGKLAGDAEYPQLQVDVAGENFLASLDTAASVALSAQGVAALGPGGVVRSTSFARHSIVRSWHKLHPDWRYVADAGQAAGVAAIRVPLLRAAAVRFPDVWFTTRPDDDVFQGEKDQLKVGPTAFGCCALTIDYVRQHAIVRHRSSGG